MRIKVKCDMEHRILIKKEFYTHEQWDRIKRKLNLDDEVTEFSIRFTEIEVKKNQMNASFDL